MNQDEYDNLAPVEQFVWDSPYQIAVDSTEVVTLITVDDVIRGVVINSGVLEATFTANVVYKCKPLIMEFYGKDDDKTLDYSQAYDEACKWAQHAAETGGDLKFNDNEESK